MAHGKCDGCMILRGQEEYVIEDFVRKMVVMLRCKPDAEANKIFFDYFPCFYQLRNFVLYMTQDFFFLCHRAVYDARFVLCIEPVDASYIGQVECFLHLFWCQFSM